MNGRLYDPLVGRFLNVDPFVQMPDGTQNYNRYSYCLNNPLKYTDPEGEIIFSIITGVVDFFSTALFKGGLDPTSKSARQEAWKNYDPTASWSNTNKAWKIEKGLFKTDSDKDFWGRSWELLSRFTWQLPQTAFGYGISDVHNLFGGVKSVDYYGGATVLQSYSEHWGAFTVSNYVIGDRSIKASPNDPLFQHEYGHYLQSQDLGPIYLLKIGLPSLIDAWINDQSEHEKAWFEADANARALNYWKSTIPGYNVIKKDWLNPEGRYASGIHAQHWYDYIPSTYSLLGVFLFNIQW